MGLLSKYEVYGGLFVLSLWTIGLSIIPAIMVKFYAPAAAGGGVTIIMALLNGNNIPDVLRPRTFITKVIGTILSVSSGLAVGPEGPLIFSGAAIASMLSRVPLWRLDATVRRHGRAAPPREVVDLVSDTTQREFMSAGAAAGLAAAFGTPIGGVLFAIEEAISAWSRKMVWRCFLAAGTASFILSQLLGLNGRSGLISFSGLSGGGDWIRQLPLIVITAATAGIVGAIFNVSHTFLGRLRASHHRRWLRILEVALVACITVAAIYGLTVAFGRCAPIPPTWLKTGETIQFGCAEGEYNDLGTFFLAQPDGIVRKLLSLGASDRDTLDEAKMHPVNMAIFVFSYFIMMSLACGTAIPGGLFLPTVMLGSSLGVLTAMMYKMVLPKWYIFYNPIQPGLFALIGATAMLTGVFRSTISVVVIMVEGTDGLVFLFPIIVSVIVGNWASHHLVSSSVYEADLEREARVAFLSPEPPTELVYLTAGDVMHASPISLRESESVSNILKALSSNKHNGFPVVEHKKGVALLRGVILRSQLLVLLGHRASIINMGVYIGNGSNGSMNGHSTPASETSELMDKSTLKALDIQMRLYHQIKHPYRRHLSSRQAELHSLGISSLLDDQMIDGSLGDVSSSSPLDDEIIDLRPYMNLGPLSVQEECPATRVHSIFRTMQLRHLCVLDKDASLVGIITRKDLHAAVSIAAPFSTRRNAVTHPLSNMHNTEYDGIGEGETVRLNINQENVSDDWQEKDDVHIAPFDDCDLPSLP